MEQAPCAGGARRLPVAPRRRRRSRDCRWRGPRRATASVRRGPSADTDLSRCRSSPDPSPGRSSARRRCGERKSGANTWRDGRGAGRSWRHRRRQGEAALRAAGGRVLWGRDDLGPPVGWCAACGRRKDHEPHAQSRTARRLPRVVDNERRLRAVVHELEEPSLSVVAADPVPPCGAEPLGVGAGRLSRG